MATLPRIVPVLLAMVGAPAWRAQADVTIRPVNSTMTVSGNSGSLVRDVDVDGDGARDLTFNLFWGTTFRHYSAVTHGVFFARSDLAPSPTFPDRLDAGAVMGPSNPLTQQSTLALDNYGGSHSGNWYQFVGTAYLGYSLPRGDGTHYGWLRIQTDQTTWTVHDLGWENGPGVPVIVPCPGAIGAAAGAGLVAVRRRGRRGTAAW